MTDQAQLGLIWDIDGTLLSNSALPMSLYIAEAIRTVWGRDVDANHMNLHGRTDLQVVSEALQVPAASVRPQMPIVEALISEKSGLDRQSLATERRILPGVFACLEAAATLVGHQTVASGAGAQRSVRKLDGHGLGAFFCWQCATFGDLAAHRTELLQDVLAKSKAHGPIRHIVVGDTPEDIVAARALGLSVIAIASGAYSNRDLADYHPDLLMECAEPADLAEFVSHME